MYAMCLGVVNGFVQTDRLRKPISVTATRRPCIVKPTVTSPIALDIRQPFIPH